MNMYEAKQVAELFFFNVLHYLLLHSPNKATV